MGNYIYIYIYFFFATDVCVYIKLCLQQLIKDLSKALASSLYLFGPVYGYGSQIGMS